PAGCCVGVRSEGAVERSLRKAVPGERELERGDVESAQAEPEHAPAECRVAAERGQRMRACNAVGSETYATLQCQHRVPCRRALSLMRAFCAMNFSAASYASSSTICFGGDFIRYALGPSSAPEMPLFSASFAIRTASITIPAEFGESQTSSFSSMLSGTLPNDEPSIRMYAHFRSVSHGTYP